MESTVMYNAAVLLVALAMARDAFASGRHFADDEPPVCIWHGLLAALQGGFLLWAFLS